MNLWLWLQWSNNMANKQAETDYYVYEDIDTGISYMFDGNVLFPINAPSKSQLNKIDKEELERQDKERKEQIKKELEDYNPDDDDSEERLKEIGDLLHDESLIQDLLDETERKVRVDKKLRKQEKKEAEKNIQGYRTDGNIKEFVIDINHLIKKEVANTTKSDWGRINKKMEGSGIYKPGKSQRKNPKIPVLFVYFDQSNSWTDADIKIGNQALATLATYEKKKKLKIETYYFTSEIYTNLGDVYRNPRGTGAGAKLIQHINSHSPDNVVVMTDSDFDSWGEILSVGKVDVPGGAFLLFRNGSFSYELIKRLHGKKMTKVYSF